jgi:beta-lactamase superfamily II metal-dependent hydrolase
MAGSKPANPTEARDANRILQAARAAQVTQIDYLLITHFHPDHVGGVPELARLMPIRNFIDHGGLTRQGSGSSTMRDAFNAYVAVRNKGHHIEPGPGDRLPLKNIEAIVVSSGTATLSHALPGAGQVNGTCGPAAIPPADSEENPRSTGIVVGFGKFRFLDVGDLSGQPLFSLACPRSLIGPVDVYLVAHHGGEDIADPATLAAFEPRIAVMNNGLSKGGSLRTYELLHRVNGLRDVWQLHRSESAGEQNFAAERIANIDESTAYWIKLSAREDGSFTVQNGRTRQVTSYPPRSDEAQR